MTTTPAVEPFERLMEDHPTPWTASDTDGLVEAFTDQDYDAELDRMRAAIGVLTTAWRRFQATYDDTDWDGYMAAMRAIIAEEQRWTTVPTA